MAAEFKFSRSHLIYGLCLPVAVILGYVLARPMDSPGLGVMVMMACVLGVPVYMRWYHPVTIFFWNAAFYLGFLPGQMPLWIACAASAFIIVLLNRCVDPVRRLMLERNVAWSLVGLAVIITLTAYSTGGIGMRSLGSGTYGGKKYVYLWAAIMGYYVLASRRIPLSRAYWYVGLFFLPGLTSLLSDAVYYVGGPFYKLFYIIPPGGAGYQMAADQGFVGDPGIERIGGWLGTSQSICLFMLARYGLKGILDTARPWRGLMVFVALAAGSLGGFRSFLIFLGMVFIVAFLLEGMHRTRYMLVAAVLTVIAGVGLTFFSTQLPYSIQRTLSFLPVQVAPYVRESADDSVDWRLEMWQDVLPDVSTHLFKGKGYALDPNELEMAEENATRGKGIAASLAEAAGDYHNGPLSVIIPFGIWGVLGLAWFLFAVGRMLFLHYLHGDPALRTINIGLLAFFIAKVIFFLTIFGAIDKDLAIFTGLAGLAVSLNGETKERLFKQTVEDELSPAYT